ncbi:MAG: hypothetical protein ACRDSK_13300 [Actinophytocola sp.]|uniref:hypothetical protein n=1 Tax=Actinophytocola sp. TaxID=1872138 RepID=UPI003D6AE431
MTRYVGRRRAGEGVRRPPTASLADRSPSALDGLARPSCRRGLAVVALGMSESANGVREIMMAGLLNRIKNALRSPKGQQMTNKAREMAKDPRNRDRARQAAQKLRRKR